MTGTTAGMENNTTGPVSSTDGGIGNTASASVVVVGPPSIAKSFAPTAIVPNGLSTLTLTVTSLR